MSWGKAQERAENHKGNGIFVRLADDGDKVVVAFCGEPYIRELVWNQKTNQYDDFTPEHEKAGQKSTPRYVLNVFDKIEKAMKVMEFSNITFKDVLKVKDKYGLDKKFFEVERSGKKGDTKTSYTILPDDPIDDDFRKLIAAAKLHDLAKIGRDDGDEQTDMSSHDKKSNGKAPATNAPGGSDAPAIITADDASALIARLKPLDKAKIEEFLKRFKVAKVKELRASDLADAKKQLDEWEGKGAQAPTEVDPFG